MLWTAGDNGLVMCEHAAWFSSDASKEQQLRTVAPPLSMSSEALVRVPLPSLPFHPCQTGPTVSLTAWWVSIQTQEASRTDPALGLSPQVSNSIRVCEAILSVLQAVKPPLALLFCVCQRPSWPSFLVSQIEKIKFKGRGGK